jgi:hypothetical protein
MGQRGVWSQEKVHIGEPRNHHAQICARAIGPTLAQGNLLLAVYGEACGVGVKVCLEHIATRKGGGANIPGYPPVMS